MIVEGRLWHLNYLVDRGLRPEDVASICNLTAHVPNETWAIDSYRQLLYKFALIDDSGKPAAFFGAYQTSFGCLHAWAVGTRDIGRTARQWLPFLRQFFDGLIASGYHRISCDVIESFAGAENVMKHLGFQREGVRRALGMGRVNAVLYARISP